MEKTIISISEIYMLATSEEVSEAKQTDVLGSAGVYCSQPLALGMP